MSYLVNHGMWGSQPWNGPSESEAIAGDQRVLYNQRSISLDWNTVEGAKFYQIQVSLYPDFRAPIVDVSIQESDYQYTDSAADNAKRYWRWRPSVSSGTDWLQPWSEVGSYWLDTSATEEIDIPQSQWALIAIDNSTDIYFFDISPIYTIIARNIYRFQGRNRAGTLLSEFLTVKDDLTLTFQGAQYIIHSHMDEFERFNNTKRTFYVANYANWKQGEPIGHIWKVECTDDPTFTMIAAGRPDIVRGQVTLIEV
jgi:hypothetical protein